MRISDWSSDVCSSDLTGSIGGFQVRKSELWHQGLYAATKYAVTALSEGLRFDLEHLGIGVSVLAPSAVSTNIGTSDRNRPECYGGPTQGSLAPQVDQMLRTTGVDPDMVGARSEEHTSELQSLLRISYAVFFLKKKKTQPTPTPP